ncbi:3'-5' exonuclease [Amycolatopsis mongoliensis]|uniref:3'-5' exonuclease n=1 Tax=Amycolatopsis mongoliensis TaxID=715475 RepID=A0A9Y2JT87_9PSEU|nr:3'-5' exonuclease [Amycolatopsis sp. 4-36]WIY04258.1 3'-5' exonuclease [Amycolatopsis sp. 4-36]
MIESLPLSGPSGCPALGFDFTAVEIRTTGLRPGHIVELAAVRVRSDGAVAGEFTTLVDPGRAVSPGSAFVHGITREELTGAPPFGAVLGPLLDLCAGSVVVAHNLPFVASFLNAEAARLGVRVPASPGACTLAAAQAVIALPNYRLATVAHAFGVPGTPAQPALTGARTAAQLAVTLFGRHGLTFAVRPAFPTLPRYAASAGLRSRPSEPSADLGWMSGVVERITIGASAGDPVTAYAYLDLLAGAVADAHLTHDEVWALAALATEAGLPDAQVRAAHEQFVAALREVAEGDGVVTTAEARELHQVATALGVAELVSDLRSTGGDRPTRVLVLGTTVAADRFRARVLSEGVQLAKKLTSTVTHLVRDDTVSAQEPRLARAAEHGAMVLAIDTAPVALGFEAAPSVERSVERPPVTRPVVTPAVPRPAAPLPRPSPQSAVVAPARTPKVLGGRILMAVGLLLMFIVVLAMFGGTPLAAGIFLAVLGVGALLGGWWLAEPAPR